MDSTYTVKTAWTHLKVGCVQAVYVYLWKSVSFSAQILSARQTRNASLVVGMERSVRGHI